ncbi:unnamed protein product [Bathycoccus prasinos]
MILFKEDYSQNMFVKETRDKKRVIKYKPFWLLLSLSILSGTVLKISPGVVKDSSQLACKPLVPNHIYSLIQSFNEISNHHGYDKVIICGQSFFRSVRIQGGANRSLMVEEFAAAMLEKYGTGFLDFQFPDSAFYNIDFGFTTFPLNFDCSSKPLSSSVYLSTMLTVHGFRVTLINSFLDYYLNIGLKARNILVTLQMRKTSKLEDVVRVLDILKGKGVYYDIFIGEWSSEALMFHQAHKLLYCTGDDDWIIVADSDEFHEYPTRDVNQFLEDLDTKKVNIVNGIFLDRVSEDGLLKEPSNKSDIFEQFILGCKLHKSFRLGTPKKVMAFKGALRINRGHHRIALCWFWNRRNYLDLTPWNSCPPKNLIEMKPYKMRLNVHHFKWMRGQYEATRQKAKVWANTSVGESYNTVLKHLERCGGICVKTQAMQCSKQNFSQRINTIHE